MNRVAQVNSQSKATISMDMIITIEETKDSTDHVTTIVQSDEIIKQKSMDLYKGLFCSQILKLPIRKEWCLWTTEN